MAAGYLADAHLPFLSGHCVQNSYSSCDAHPLEDLLDGFVVFLGGDEGQEFVRGGVGVALSYRAGGAVQRDYDCLGVLGDGFVRDVLERIVNKIGLLEFQQVSHAASYAALENKDVALPGQPGTVREVSLVDGAHFVQGNEDGRPVKVCPYLERVERVFLDYSGIRAPVDKCPEFLEKVIDSVLPPRARLALVGESLEVFRMLPENEVLPLREGPEV